ncbi:CBS domain-containing protein [Atopomonas hussainii]|uniref:CBS domain-containing protein n=1 Tax=Atopomonas hussainii TaxID=1429083 RepID=A0A1H7KBB7_9GAMM|nr:putative nucleotidyltransferase substrate binding domain-containing protein [Atopomonas hussainii]SEK84173.1 CBS domain-containing protein [Atopomonas hussainii]
MTREQAFAEAGRTAVQQNIHGTMEFLRKYPPFAQMLDNHLSYLVERCVLQFYCAGETILAPADGPVQHFYIVKQGLVRGERAPADGEQQHTFEISGGECFPLAALLGERATRTRHLASEDTFCLQLPREAFVRLFAECTVFRDFALRGVSSLLDHVNQQAQRDAVAHLGASYSLDTPLAELMARTPVTCASDTPLQAAVKTMHEQHVGSMLITDDAQRPLGIFTLRDLRRVVADGLADFQQPISQWMTPQPFALPSSASAFDAAMAMTERHIAHIAVVDQQRLVGVLSERDLFSLQRVDLVHLARAIRHAASFSALQSLRGDIQRLVDSMLAHGASSVQVTHLITLLNDHSVARVIELVIAELGDPGIAFTWLVFGSEGRCEQTLHTDQDNGMLFSCDATDDSEALRQRLLPIAQRINQELDHLGFTLCKGNIMAGNPELCLSEHEWQQRFARMISSATPENLLGSSIYFDLRSVYGPTIGVERLQQFLLSHIQSNTLFQRMLAENALRQRPPLGLFRDFVVAKSGAEKHTLDLKVQGLTPFVDAARLLALANQIAVSSTLARFAALVERGVVDSKDADAFEEAYNFIQLTRLQLHQRQSREGRPLSNRIDPDALNPLDRRILRESFRQAQRLQASLALRYKL